MSLAALPQSQWVQALAKQEVVSAADVLRHRWATWRATHPDPAEIEQMRQEIGRMLSDRVEDAP
jgi:hypothetical protein